MSPPKVLLYLTLFILCSCSVQPHPTISGALLTGARRDEILASLRQRSEELKSLRGLAHVRALSSDGASSYRQVVAFVIPDRLRLEALPTNGVFTLNLLVLKGERVRLLDPAAKQALESADAESLLRSHTKIPVAPADLMSLFAGVLPLRALREGEDELRIYNDSASHSYTLVRGDFFEFFRIDQASLGLIEVQIRSRFDDRLRATLNYAAPKTEYSGLRDIDLNLPEEKTTMSFSWTNVILNQPVPEKLFEVEIPADYSVYQK